MPLDLPLMMVTLLLLCWNFFRQRLGNAEQSAYCAFLQLFGIMFLICMVRKLPHQTDIQNLIQRLGNGTSLVITQMPMKSNNNVSKPFVHSKILCSSGQLRLTKMSRTIVNSHKDVRCKYSKQYTAYINQQILTKIPCGS